MTELNTMKVTFTSHGRILISLVERQKLCVEVPTNYHHWPEVWVLDQKPTFACTIRLLYLFHDIPSVRQLYMFSCVCVSINERVYKCTFNRK